MSTEPNKHDDLAERIRAVHGQRLIVPWRMDANQDVWHALGLDECGCGISGDDPPVR
jgi:hypothetical protein